MAAQLCKRGIGVYAVLFFGSLHKHHLPKHTSSIDSKYLSEYSWLGDAKIIGSQSPSSHGMDVVASVMQNCGKHHAHIHASTHTQSLRTPVLSSFMRHASVPGRMADVLIGMLDN